MKIGVVIAIGVVLVLAVGGGAFWAGMSYGKSQLLKSPEALLEAMRNAGTMPFGQRFQGQGGQLTGTGTGQGGIRAPGGGVTGTIEKVEGDTIVLSTNDGVVKVKVSDSTIIQKTVEVPVSDLEVGKQVIVAGSANEDGSINARSIRPVEGRIQIPLGTGGR